MLGRKLNLCSWSAGHVHAYERSVRVFNNRPHECGSVHIVIGDGGNREVSRCMPLYRLFEHRMPHAKHNQLHSSMLICHPALIVFALLSHSTALVSPPLVRQLTTLLCIEQGLSRDYLDQPRWSAMREASYGHATLDFESATAATFRWHRNQVQTQQLLAGIEELVQPLKSTGHS